LAYPSEITTAAVNTPSDLNRAVIPLRLPGAGPSLQPTNIAGTDRALHFGTSEHRIREQETPSPPTIRSQSEGDCYLRDSACRCCCYTTTSEPIELCETQTIGRKGRKKDASTFFLVESRKYYSNSHHRRKKKTRKRTERALRGSCGEDGGRRCWSEGKHRRARSGRVWQASHRIGLGDAARWIGWGLPLVCPSERAGHRAIPNRQSRPERSPERASLAPYVPTSFLSLGDARGVAVRLAYGVRRMERCFAPALPVSQTPAVSTPGPS